MLNEFKIRSLDITFIENNKENMLEFILSFKEVKTDFVIPAILVRLVVTIQGGFE